MSTDPVLTFVQQLRQSQLLDAAQLDEVERLRATATRPAQLAGALVQRGWLTPHQANQVALGRGAGLILGSYLVLEPIGSGGMGQVVKARHRFMQRNVALKLIRQDQRDSADILERFQRETRLLAELRHSHIVQAYDAGLAGDVWFLAMELLEGIDLAGFVHQRGRLPVGLACEYIRQAALGLQHAHQRGLVHRDIKPSNLFLTGEGVKLLDLGLARPQASGGQGGELTQNNSVMGTPDYLAPEQAVDPRKAGTRSDLYSLGCTFYFLLTGQPPFPEGTLTQKLLAHQQMEATPIERVRPDTPPALAILLRRMLAKQPEDRPANAAEVAAQLVPFADAVAASSVGPTSTVPGPPASANRGKSVLVEQTVMPAVSLPAPMVMNASAADRAGLLSSETVHTNPMTSTSVLTPSNPALHDQTQRMDAPSSPAGRPSAASSWPALLRRYRVPIGAGASGVLLLLLLFAFWPGKDNKADPDSPSGKLGPSPRIEGAALRTINMNPELTAWLSFSRDGKKLGATGFIPWRWRTLVWGTQNDDQFGEIEKASCLTYSPDGKYLACGHPGGEVHLLDPETHALIQSFAVEKTLTPIRGLRFSADGQRLLCFGVGNPAVWDFKENGPLRSFPRVDAFPEEFYRASLTDISPDGKLLATGTRRALQVMAVDTPNHSQEHFPVPEGVISTAFSRDGKYLAAGFKKGGVALAQVLSKDGSPQITKGDLPLLRIPMPRSLAFHPKSHLLVAGTEEGKLYLAAAEKNWEVSEVRAHPEAVTVLSFSPDGKMLATGDRKGTIKLWEVKP